MYHVQIERHSELLRKAKSTYTKHKISHGKRGVIYDTNGNLLVGNIPIKEITADPSVLKNSKNPQKTAKELARYFKDKLNLSNKRALRIYKELLQPYRIDSKGNILYDKDGKPLPDRWMLIAREVDFMLACKMEKELKKRGINKAIIFTEHSKRIYPKGELLANVLGFTNVEKDKENGKSGIESRLNKSMASKISKGFYEKGARGIPLSYGFAKTESVRNGSNVYLTIDEPVQAIVEEEIDKLMEKWDARAAYVVMVEPRTGNIIAMAQRPTFNPNDRSTYTPDRYRNRLIEDTFEPGSTMKPIVISRALDNMIVTPSTLIDCENGYWQAFRLKDSHHHKMLSVADIIKVSSNIGTAKIALKMGKVGLYKTFWDFGFGQRTGIPLWNETKGLLPHYSKWYEIKITRACIGQGVNTSPMQLARAYCALANNGELPKLRLVDRIENPNTGKVRKIPFAPKKRLYKRKSTHKELIEMMKLVTQEGGTASNVAIDGYYIAGKTGTSQKFIKGSYSDTKFFATFVGFVPADNPRFVLLVTVDEPKKKHYGGTVAGPAFKSIAEKTLKYYNVEPDYLLAE